MMVTGPRLWCCQQYSVGLKHDTLSLSLRKNLEKGIPIFSTLVDDAHALWTVKGITRFQPQE